MLSRVVSRRSICRAKVVLRCYCTMAPKEKRNGQQQQRSAHYSSHIRVLNVDNATASPSVLLFFDKDRYLFNAGEGIQRHFIEHKQRMKKVTHVLATRVSTDTLAGLPGMLLSQVEPGVDVGKAGGAAVAANITGPPGLSQYADAFRMYASNFSLRVNDLGAADSQATVNGASVSIKAVLLAAAPAAPSKLKAAADDKAAAAAAEEAEPAAKKPRHDAPAEDVPGTEGQPAATGATEAAAAASNAAATHSRGMASVHSNSGLQPPVACYVCQLASIPGKFDPQKAAQLGVPKGPLYGQLQRGNAVTSVSGRTVQPHMVMDTPTMPGPCLIIVDCPSLDYLPALKNDTTLQGLQQEARAQQQQQQERPPAEQPTDAAAGAGAEQAEQPVQKRFVLVHLGPSSISSNAEYRAWCQGFGPGAQQLFVSSDGQCCSTTRRAAELQAQLNVIEPDVFSLTGLLSLKQTTQQQQQQQEEGAQGQDVSTAGAADAAGAGTGGVVHQAADGVVIKLAPARFQGLYLDEALTQPPDLDGVQAEVREKHPKVMQLLQEYAAAKATVLQEQQQQPAPQLQGIDRNTCALTPLGTCSACPSNHRNVSAYYLDLFERGGLLMDCGEDTLGQLERRYGRAEAHRRILQLHAIWISHMHADHHGGLYPLLLLRQALLQQQQQQQEGSEAAGAGVGGSSAQSMSDTADGKDQAAAAGISSSTARPLLILGPFPLFRVLCQYSKVLPLSFTFLPNHSFFTASARQPPAEALAAYEAVKAAAGLAVLQPFPVQHVSHSSGLQVQAQSGWKVVFSGDTRPCQAVIDAAKDATLLVHEATFEDELQDEAIAKKHSTTAEALGVAAAANAYRTLLTHFSTRYPRIPVMKPPGGGAGGEEGGADGDGGSDLAAVGSALVGFDLMTVNLADLPWLPKMLPVLDELFKEEEAAYLDDDDGDGGGRAGGGGADGQ